MALAVRSLHRVEINKHRIQRKAIRSLYKENAMGSVYRENRSAVYTGGTDPHRIRRRSNRQMTLTKGQERLSQRNGELTHVLDSIYLLN